jgi:hypothetical protein
MEGSCLENRSRLGGESRRWHPRQRPIGHGLHLDVLLGPGEGPLEIVGVDAPVPAASLVVVESGAGAAGEDCVGSLLDYLTHAVAAARAVVEADDLVEMPFVEGLCVLGIVDFQGAEDATGGADEEDGDRDGETTGEDDHDEDVCGVGKVKVGHC